MAIKVITEYSRTQSKALRASRSSLSSHSFLEPRLNEPSELIFAPSLAHTIGVEMELQIIDPNSLDLYPIGEKLINDWAERDDRLSPELLLSMIEVNTGICRTVAEAERDLRATIASLYELCKHYGAELSANGTHPTASHKGRKLYPSQRYQDLIDRNQFIARRLMIFGLHVHIGARSGEHCIQMNNRFLHYLPHLLALSASSPFWEGEDTGLASSRITAFESLPTGGHPCTVASWEEYQLLVAKLIKSKSIRDLKDIWWDIRPSPKYGTLEIRICDGLPSIRETLAVVAFIQCLAVWFDETPESNRSASVLPTWLMRENKWRAARHGLSAEIIINEQAETRPLREDLELVLEHLQPIARRFGYHKYFSVLREMIQGESSYMRQKRVFAETGELKQVTQSLIEEFRSDLNGLVDDSKSSGIDAALTC